MYILDVKKCIVFFRIKFGDFGNFNRNLFWLFYIGFKINIYMSILYVICDMNISSEIECSN